MYGRNHVKFYTKIERSQISGESVQARCNGSDSSSESVGEIVPTHEKGNKKNICEGLHRAVNYSFVVNE